MQVADARDLRKIAFRRLVDRRQVMEVQQVELRGAGRGELAPPGSHLVLEGGLVERREHAIRRADPILERGMKGWIGDERIGRLAAAV